MADQHDDGGPITPAWDHYAGQALAGLLANPSVAGSNGVYLGAGVLVRLAADYADAMVAERARRIGGQADG